VYGIKEQGRYLAKAIIETEKELRIAENGGPGNVAALRRALHGLTSADGGNVINLEGWTAGNDSVTLASERLTDLQTRFIAARGAYEQAEISLRSRVSSLYLVQKALAFAHHCGFGAADARRIGGAHSTTRAVLAPPGECRLKRHLSLLICFIHSV
jgi:hypothetical protein